MDRPFVVLGDKTDHGGVVVSASANTSTGERGIACIGDMVACPLPGHGTNPIVSGSPFVTIDGRAAARDQDMTACGSKLIAGQSGSASA